MRLERHGGEPDLESAFESLIIHQLHGKVLDENKNQEAREGKFPDFSCFNDLVLIEMKHLETDQTPRVNDVFQQKLNPAEAPVFYGERNSGLITSVVSNGDAINAEIASKLSRTIETILSKANSQFLSYRERNPRKNSVNLCVILNSKLPEYSPEVMAYAFKGKIKLGMPDERFPSIDGILYISEKHFRTLPDGRNAFAMLECHAAGIRNHPWKINFLNRIVDAWSNARTGQSSERDNRHADFETIQDVPGTMRRSEAWSLEYQREPYLQKLTLNQLRVHFHRIIALNSLSFLKGNWPKPEQKQTIAVLRRLQHANDEINKRGLNLRELDYKLLTDHELLQVHAGLPAEFIQMMRSKNSTPPR